jgi:hypothetical protein
MGVLSRYDVIRDFHSGVANILAFAFGLHIVGALWHRIVRRDGVMQSISLGGSLLDEGMLRRRFGESASGPSLQFRLMRKGPLVIPKLTYE